jgi:hypothetical protein
MSDSTVCERLHKPVMALKMGEDHQSRNVDDPKRLKKVRKALVPLNLLALLSPYF